MNNKNSRRRKVESDAIKISEMGDLAVDSQVHLMEIFIRNFSTRTYSKQIRFTKDLLASNMQRKLLVARK